MQTKAIHTAHGNPVSSAVKAPIAKTELPGFAAVLQQASPGFVQALQDASAQTAAPSLSEEPQCLAPKSGQAAPGTEADKDLAPQRAALAQVAVAKVASEIAPRANAMLEAQATDPARSKQLGHKSSRTLQVSPAADGTHAATTMGSNEVQAPTPTCEAVSNASPGPLRTSDPWLNAVAGAQPLLAGNSSPGAVAQVESGPVHAVAPLATVKPDGGTVAVQPHESHIVTASADSAVAAMDAHPHAATVTGESRTMALAVPIASVTSTALPQLPHTTLTQRGSSATLEAASAPELHLLHGFNHMDGVVQEASSNVLEIGVPSQEHGWMSIRASLNDGAVSASIVSSTAHGHALLHRSIPELTNFLSGERVQVASLTVQRQHSAGGASAEEQSAGRGARRESGAARAVLERSSEGNENLLALTMPVASGGNGSWLNVRV